MPITRAQYLDKLLGRPFEECSCQRGNRAENPEGNEAENQAPNNEENNLVPNQESNSDFCLRCDVYRVKEALKYAHEIRQFEIELYWKRALYFWGFCLTLFGAYILIITAETDVFVDNEKWYLFSISLIGIFASIAWLYIEKGSKSHMENWAIHIDYLEDKITGRLLKTIMGKKENFFSPSKINQWIIIFISILWGFFLFIPHFDFATKVAKNICARFDRGYAIANVVFFIVGLIFAFYIIFYLLNEFFPRKWKTGDDTMPDPENAFRGENYDLHQRVIEDE